MHTHTHTHKKWVSEIWTAATRSHSNRSQFFFHIFRLCEDHILHCNASYYFIIVTFYSDLEGGGVTYFSLHLKPFVSKLHLVSAYAMHAFVYYVYIYCILIVNFAFKRKMNSKHTVHKILYSECVWVPFIILCMTCNSHIIKFVM